MKTILEQKMGNATIVREQSLQGPRGSQGWTLKTLSDGRIVLIGPDTHGILPKWVKKFIPKGHIIERAGGTTFKWNRWISKIE